MSVNPAHHLSYDKCRGWEFKAQPRGGAERIKRRLRTHDLAEAIERRDRLVAELQAKGIELVMRRQQKTLSWSERMAAAAARRQAAGVKPQKRPQAKPRVKREPNPVREMEMAEEGQRRRDRGREVDLCLAVAGALLRPGETRTLTELAAFVPITRQGLWVIEQKALKKLRKKLECLPELRRQMAEILK